MFKDFLKEKGISEEDFAKKSPEEMAKLHSEYAQKRIDDLKDQIEKAAKPEDIEKIKKEISETLKDVAKNASVDELKKDFEAKLQKAQDDFSVEMTAFKEGIGAITTQNVTFKGAVRAALEEKHEDLKSFLQEKNKGGWFDIQVKVPEATTSSHVTTATTPDNYAASNASGYSPFIRPEVYIEQYLDVGTTDRPSLPYVNEEAGEGDAAMVAEGGLKPLIDADFNVKYSEAKKVAGRMKASEEALFDFAWLESAMTTTLKRKHDIVRQNNILDGDGTGANLTGIKLLATPFNAALLDGINIVADPNNFDIIASLVTAIAVQSEGVFMPNVVFLNNADVLDMKLKKDGDNNYVLPPFISQDGRVVDGVTIVEKPTLTAGEFIIGDMRNLKLRNVWDYTVRIGMENDDFSRNMVTMIGESRLHLYITDSDKRGIITGTLANVVAKLTTP